MKRIWICLLIGALTGCSDNSAQKLEPLTSGPKKMDVSAGGGGGAKGGKSSVPVPPTDAFSKE